MNLLLASVDAFPKMGGVSTLAHHLASTLADQGHRIVFLGPRGTCVPRDYRRSYLLLEDWASRQKDREGAPGLEQDARIRELFALVIRRYAIERVLLLHPFYYGIGALDACDLARIPLSVYFHGLELRSQLRGKYPIDQLLSLRQRRLETLRDRLVYLITSADEILTNSRFTAGLFDPFRIKPPVRHTGCGIPEADLERELVLSPSYCAAERRERRHRLGLPAETSLGYVGRLIGAKRVERLLSLCHLDPGFSAVIVGDGPDEPRLKTLAERWNVQSRVRFVGRVNEDAKWEILRALDFLCLLSEPDDHRGSVEGFGIALLEGAAAGAVPVTSGTGGMPDVVEDGATGLVLPEDDARAVEVLLSHARSRSLAGLTERARSQLETRYTWTRVAERIVEGWSR